MRHRCCIKAGLTSLGGREGRSMSYRSNTGHCRQYGGTSQFPQPVKTRWSIVPRARNPKSYSRSSCAGQAQSSLAARVGTCRLVALSLSVCQHVLAAPPPAVVVVVESLYQCLHRWDDGAFCRGLVVAVIYLLVLLASGSLRSTNALFSPSRRS